MIKVTDLTDEQIIVQCRRMKASKYPNSQIAKTLQISPRSVTWILTGDNWKWSAKQLVGKITVVRDFGFGDDY